MDIKQLNPWNWFKHEEKQQEKSQNVPVKQAQYLQSASPVSNLMQFHREIDRLFEDAFRGFPMLDRFPNWGMLSSDDFMPAFRASINVASDEKRYTISLEAPGMEQKDLTIEVRNHTLVVRGNKQQEQEEKDKHYYRVERNYGAFERVLELPDDALVADISASMKNGVLTILIPRKETPKTEIRKISISHG